MQACNRTKLTNNEKYFQYSTTGEFDWNSNEGKEFRKYFKQYANNNPVKVGVPEHRVETAIIQAMKNRTSKNKGKLLGYQPVLLNGTLPFQVPIPISGASKGVPVYKPNTNGNIDILARKRCNNNKVTLSVWELKSPGTITNHTLSQAYIYSVVLLYMLRSRCGKEWFNLFGFNVNVPENLEVETVVAISNSKKHKDRCYKQIAELKKHNPLNIGPDVIKLAVALYNDDTFDIEEFDEV